MLNSRVINLQRLSVAHGKLLILTIFLCSTSLSAQDAAIDRAMEWLADQSLSEEIDWIEVEAQLRHYLDEPISVQGTDYATLSALPLITIPIAINIALYVDRGGKILDWGELTNIRGIDEEWIARTRSFLTLSEPPSRENPIALRKTKFNFNQGIFSQWPRSTKGKEQYAGSPWMDQGRISLGSGPWDAGIRWQRDAWEPWLPVKKGLWDHWSGFIDWQSPDRQWKISLGDYRVGFAMGLLSASGFFGSTTSDPNQLFRLGRGVRPVASGSEFNHFGGMTARFKNARWESQFATGYREWDGRFDDGELVSISQSGLHRTATEILRRRNTVVHNLSGRVGYRGRIFRSGINVIANYFNTPFENRSPWGGISADIQYMFRRQHIQSEVAVDWLGNPAWSAAWSIRTESVTWAIRYSRSGRNHKTILGSLPGAYDSPGAQNIEMAVQWENRGTKWSGSVLGGRKWFYNGREIRPGRRTGLRIDRSQNLFGLKWDLRLSVSREDESVETDHEETRIYLRSQWDKSSGIFQYRARADLHRLAGTKPTSWMILTEWGYKMESGSLNLRYILHSTAETTIPIYVMDRTTSMRMGILRLGDSGSTWNLLFRQNITDQLKIALQLYYNTLYYETSRGSGIDETIGGNRWGFNFEWQYRFP